MLSKWWILKFVNLEQGGSVANGNPVVVYPKKNPLAKNYLDIGSLMPS